MSSKARQFLCFLYNIGYKKVKSTPPLSSTKKTKVSDCKGSFNKVQLVTKSAQLFCLSSNFSLEEWKPLLQQQINMFTIKVRKTCIRPEICTDRIDSKQF